MVCNTVGSRFPHSGLTVTRIAELCCILCFLCTTSMICWFFHGTTLPKCAGNARVHRFMPILGVVPVFPESHFPGFDGCWDVDNALVA